MNRDDEDEEEEENNENDRLFAEELDDATQIMLLFFVSPAEGEPQTARISGMGDAGKLVDRISKSTIWLETITSPRLFVVKFASASFVPARI